MMFHELVGLNKIREENEPDTVWEVSVDTFEPNDQGVNELIMSHRFYGPTEAVARHRMASHKKSDPFFADCFKGKWKDVKCSNSKVSVKRVKKSLLK